MKTTNLIACLSLVGFFFIANTYAESPDDQLEQIEAPTVQNTDVSNDKNKKQKRKKARLKESPPPIDIKTPPRKAPPLS
jgi:hypothetical protein